MKWLREQIRNSGNQGRAVDAKNAVVAGLAVGDIVEHPDEGSVDTHADGVPDSEEDLVGDDPGGQSKPAVPGVKVEQAIDGLSAWIASIQSQIGEDVISAL